MLARFRPWYKEEEKARLVEYAQRLAKGNEIVSVEVLNNIYGKAFMRVKFKTATERQAKYGLYDLHSRGVLLEKMPKKYQPEFI